ncbi:MAG: ankyrin repeat domain-containing protein, partial [Gemmatimonadetes bacterium]|nr:ankyrin repeat domain-containing protein [Gemmatimonadota bacterium]
VNVRATLRKQLHPGYDDHRLVEYHDVTPVSWGRRFHQQVFVNRGVLELLVRHGAIE